MSIETAMLSSLTVDQLRKELADLPGNLHVDIWLTGTVPDQPKRAVTGSIQEVAQMTDSKTGQVRFICIAGTKR